MGLVILDLPLQLIILAVALGSTLPLLGVFVILRREALLSDALAHVILLGIALSVLANVHVLLGILVFALLAGIGIFIVSSRTTLNLDAVVGVFFTTSLALAALIIPSEELLEAFLGNLENIGPVDVGLAVVLAIILIATLLVRFREFAFVSFAPDLAHVDKIRVRIHEFFFILTLALGVAMGIKLVGTLLISALVIIPAATAKLFSRQIRTMTIWSIILGLIAVVGGLFVAGRLGLPSGPAITLTAAAIFVVILTLKSLYGAHRLIP